MAIGCVILVSCSVKKSLSKTCMISIVLSVLFISCAVSFSGHYSTYEMFDLEYQPNYFIDQDIDVLTFAQRYVSDVNDIRSDREINLYLFRTDSGFSLRSIRDNTLLVKIIHQNYERTHNIRYILIPEHEYLSTGLRLYSHVSYNEGQTSIEYSKDGRDFEIFIPEYDVVYSNDSDNLYLSNGFK